MLTSNELASLQELLAEDSKTFDDLKTSFESFFPKGDHFKVGLTLSILIKDHKLSLYQEIASFYILYFITFQSSEKDIHPFNSLAVEMLEETSLKVKRKFLIDFLQKKITYTDMKILDIREFAEKIEVPSADSKEYQDIIKKYKEVNKNFLSLPPLLSPTTSDKKFSDNKALIQNNNSLIPLSSKETSFRYFESNYMSFYPNLKINNKFFTNEPFWFLPMMSHKYIWENSTEQKISTLLNQILNNIPLSKDESKFIVTSLTKNPNIIRNISFSPKQMMILIEKDEPLSSEIFTIACKISLNE